MPVTATNASNAVLAPVDLPRASESRQHVCCQRNELEPDDEPHAKENLGARRES